MMELKPTAWTHHHTFRCLHLSGFLAFIGFCILVGSNLLSVALPTHAETVSVVGLVGVINPGPASPGGPPPGNPTPPSPYTPYTTIEARNIVGTQLALYNNGPVTVPVVREGYLALFGSSNAPQGNISINFPTNPVRISGVSIKNDGTWEWTSAVRITSGLYDIVLTIMDGQAPELQNTEHYLIWVTSAKGADFQPTPTSGSGKTPGNTTSTTTQQKPNPNTPTIPINKPGKGTDVVFPALILTVDPGTKNIAQGGRLVVRLSSTPFAYPKTNKSLIANFKITNAKDQVILNTNDTLSFTSTINYVKTFYTDTRIAPGEYKISVTIPYEGTELSSADGFKIIQKALISIGTNAIINYTGIFIALIIILVAATIISYLELVRVISLSKVIKKVDEQILSESNFL